MAVCLEDPGNNDTSAGEHGSRSSVRGVSQHERELRGIRQPCQAVLAYSVPHRGRENYKSMAGHYALLWRVGITFFVEEGFQIQIVEKGRTHTYFMIPDYRGIRDQGRKTPDKRTYRTEDILSDVIQHWVGFTFMIGRCLHDCGGIQEIFRTGF